MHLETTDLISHLINVICYMMIKNTRRSVLYTSTIKWIYFTRGSNIFLCCPRMHRRCQRVRNSTVTNTNQCLQSIGSFYSAIGLLVKPSVTAVCYTTSKCHHRTGTICKGKKKRGEGQFKKITPSSRERGTGVVLQVNRRA